MTASGRFSSIENPVKVIGSPIACEVALDNRKLGYTVAGRSNFLRTMNKFTNALVTNGRLLSH